MKETGRKDDGKQTLASIREANVNHQEIPHSRDDSLGHQVTWNLLMHLAFMFVLIIFTPYSDLLKYIYLCSHLFLTIVQ